MVKEFGDQFEQFTLEFFKRIVNCPIVVRDYGFRKIGKTKTGKTRENPTDLDVLAISKDKIYAITCQEWLPSGEKNAEREIERLVDNLNQAIKNIEEEIGLQNKEVIPVIAFIGIKEEKLGMLNNKVKEIIKRKVYLLSFKDMLFKFIEKWRESQKSWMPAGDFDWFFSRFFCQLLKIDEGLIEQLKKSIESKNKKRIYYSTLLAENNQNEFEFLSTFP